MLSVTMCFEWQECTYLLARLYDAARVAQARETAAQEFLNVTAFLRSVNSARNELSKLKLGLGEAREYAERSEAHVPW